MTTGLNISHSSFLSGLGLVADGKRKIKPIPPDLLALVPKPKNLTVEIKPDDTDPERDTVPLMKERITECVYQVEKLAPHLKGSSTLDTVRNDWNFVFNHIQYVEDPDKVEAVRDPAVTIHHKKGDCDCFSVLLGTLLRAQKIPFKIRIAAYSNVGEWSHVYIVVPDKGKEIIVDPVLHKFNHEASYLDKKDFDMKLVSLQGLGECKPFDPDNMVRFVDTESVYMMGYIPTQQFLEENNIPYHQNAGSDQTKFVISTPGGEMSLPTIISQDMANKVLGLFKMAKDKATEVVASLQSKFKWWWVVVGFGVLYLLMSGGEKSKGLSGIPALSGAKKKRKAKTLAL